MNPVKLTKIGPVDFEVIGLTEIAKCIQQETAAEHITHRAC